ncbi:MAG TPA: DUF5668 domain-containing protein [Vicinamibacteria bacterium]
MTPGERPGPDWPRAAKGILLVGIAVFLLLNNLGMLPWSFWLDAIALWPLLIISAGIGIAFDKSRAPWLVMLGPVVVLGGLAWLASGARPGLPSGPWQPEVVARPAGAKRVELDASLVGARLWIDTTDDIAEERLVDGRSLRRNENARIEATADGAQARVELKGGTRRGSFFFLPRPREHWDLHLPRSLPLSLRLNGVGIGGRLDLATAPFEGAHAEGVFIGLEARLPAPPRDTDIRINGVFNSLTVTVPQGTPVRVHGQRLPFNALDRGVAGAMGQPGYDVRVDGIFNAVAVQVESRPLE